MKRYFIIPLLFLASAAFANAQIGAAPTSDVLGAHLNYGRGCAACHAPHSGAYGSGNAKTADPTSGAVALWGEDVGSLYGKTIVTGSTNGTTGYTEVLPTTFTATTGDVSGLLTCLSCHDGNYATGAMMRNAVYESLPSTYGKLNTIPTLLSNASNGNSAGMYLNDHPVGTTAIIGCGGSHNWDCNISAAGKILMNGPKSSLFIQNYGFFVSPAVNTSLQPIVVCTTCHNQHLMNVVSVTNGVTITGTGTTGTVTGNSGLPTGYYATMFFVRAPYNPADGNAYTNQTAQFCRQCHGGEANEMNNSSAVTVF